ncbi:MAG: hypothetical protein JWM82_4059 [Myxococcales bacterium]|nr:hypothetical protein [Myxococcales bacterium]
MSKRANISAGTCVVALFGLVAVPMSGCDKFFMQAPLCSPLGDCGGSPPLGEWALAPDHSSCTEDLYTPLQDTRLLAADQPAARTPPPDPALYDWCDLLIVTGGTDTVQHLPVFFAESAPIGAAWARYDAPDPNTGYGQFATGITRTGNYSLDFPTYCIREFGAPELAPSDPADMNSAPQHICDRVQTQIQAKLNMAGAATKNSFKNTHCAVNPADTGGCVCTFDLSQTVGISGAYQLLSSNTLLEISSTKFPQRITFCNKGDHIELTGANGSYLFEQPGLRTLDLAKVAINCADGVMGPGEEGVDCGSACPTPCM